MFIYMMMRRKKEKYNHAIHHSVSYVHDLVENVIEI